MLKFVIDPNDPKFEIADGGCVDECMATLVTSNLRLHHNVNTIDFTNPAHHKIVLNLTRDGNLFQHSTLVMGGEVIGSKTSKLKISFGGLIGEFQMNQQTNIPDGQKMYLFVS